MRNDFPASYPKPQHDQLAAPCLAPAPLPAAAQLCFAVVVCTLRQSSKAAIKDEEVSSRREVVVAGWGPAATRTRSGLFSQPHAGRTKAAPRYGPEFSKAGTDVGAWCRDPEHSGLADSRGDAPTCPFKVSAINPGAEKPRSNAPRFSLCESSFWLFSLGFHLVLSSSCPPPWHQATVLGLYSAQVNQRTGMGLHPALDTSLGGSQGLSGCLEPPGSGAELLGGVEVGGCFSSCSPACPPRCPHLCPSMCRRVATKLV